MPDADDIPTRVKDPQDRLDYGFDWAVAPPDGPWLSDGDTITSSTWTITLAPDSALVIDTSDNTTTVTRVWLSGGTLGQDYQVTNHVTTAQGRQRDRSIYIKVRNR